MTAMADTSTSTRLREQPLPCPQAQAFPSEMVFGYVRSVSDRPGYLAACREQLAIWCARQGWELRAVFTDTCSGLDVEDRPGFRGLLAALADHQAAAVVLPDGGHLSRTVEVVDVLAAQLLAHGVELRVMDGGLPPVVVRQLAHLALS
ncbi:recombinase family protein [Actinokineospora bangkokensis]|uniref:Resolvase/invertase-type recombinase catalytic domain-containing protein n=1 Tax=Actinokineospora bangkokensis TaxID=1193682 RepID=A0A1Q9LBY5_9PSEU|nr:recombinase family protein [Actinokineospora bangkokensis]OLR89542.1 hypothetical protein BJP25_05555 [Actinokineospora bangkokensis]